MSWGAVWFHAVLIFEYWEIKLPLKRLGCVTEPFRGWGGKSALSQANKRLHLSVDNLLNDWWKNAVQLSVNIWLKCCLLFFFFNRKATQCGPSLGEILGGISSVGNQGRTCSYSRLHAWAFKSYKLLLSGHYLILKRDLGCWILCAEISLHFWVGRNNLIHPFRRVFYRKWSKAVW